MSFQLISLVFGLTVFCTYGFYLYSESKKNRVAIYIFKSLGTILIILYACFLGDFSTSYQKLIVIGLILSLIGDILLIKEEHFAFGLLSFLIAHLFYISAFVIEVKLSQAFYLPSLLPFALFAITISTLINNQLGKLKIPVNMYILVIVIMGWQSLNQYLLQQNTYALLAFLGAVLFMLSDSLIALNRFRKRIEHERVLIMSTYYLGQFLIAGSIHGIN